MSCERHDIGCSKPKQSSRSPFLWVALMKCSVSFILADFCSPPPPPPKHGQTDCTDISDQARLWMGGIHFTCLLGCLGDGDPAIWRPCCSKLALFEGAKWWHYSAYRILWLSPCDKITQNRVLWLFFKCPFSSQELSPYDNYRPVTIFCPCPEVVTISDKHCSNEPYEFLPLTDGIFSFRFTAP